MISLGLCSCASRAHLVHVDALVVAAHAIGHRLEPFAGMLAGEPWVRWPPAARSRPMKVSPGCISAMNTGVGRRAGMRLHIGETAAEQLRDALDRQPLGDIDVFAAAVIALARKPFGIFVGEHRALRLQHGARRRCFRRRSARSCRAGGRARVGSPRRSRDRLRADARRRSHHHGWLRRGGAKPASNSPGAASFDTGAEYEGSPGLGWPIPYRPPTAKQWDSGPIRAQYLAFSEAPPSALEARGVLAEPVAAVDVVAELHDAVGVAQAVT